MMKPLADEDLKPIISMILKEKGIDLSIYKDKYLRRRIAVRLRASGARNLKQYLKLISRDEAESRAFLNVLTVNTSNFFRNSQCFDIIDREIIPEIVSSAEIHSHRPPYIWSVGCSRGQEAYSMAMLIARYPLISSENLRPPILATDIDEVVLKEARAGVYRKSVVGAIPPDIREIFKKEDEQTYRVPLNVRKLVTFARHDILKDKLPGRYLLVLCRNLIIYMEKEAQEKVMSRLARALHPGGYLVLGKSEILIGEARDKFVPISARERIYKRISTDHIVSTSISGSRRKE